MMQSHVALFPMVFIPLYLAWQGRQCLPASPRSTILIDKIINWDFKEVFPFTCSTDKPIDCQTSSQSTTNITKKNYPHPSSWQVYICLNPLVSFRIRFEQEIDFLVYPGSYYGVWLISITQLCWAVDWYNYNHHLWTSWTSKYRSFFNKDGTSLCWLLWPWYFFPSSWHHLDFHYFANKLAYWCVLLYTFINFLWAHTEHWLSSCGSDLLASLTPASAMHLTWTDHFTNINSYVFQN